MTACFQPPPNLPPTRRALLALLAGLGCRPTTRIQETWIVLDTPDHRLAQAGFVLVRRLDEVVLWAADHVGTAATVAVLPMAETEVLPRHLHGWPDGPLRQAVAPITRNRALLPQTTLHLDRQHAEQRDEDGKVVTTLTCHLVGIEGRDSRWWLTLGTLRGYQVKARDLGRAITLRGWIPDDRDPLLDLLGDGRPPTAPPWFADGAAPARDALQACLRRVLTELEVLTQGVIDDIDVEYLHQHRVTLRRLRSLVGQLNGVFADLDTTRIRTRLAAWARCSNELRDLDVWQMDRPHLVAAVPLPFQPALAALIDHLTAERARAHREVARLLGGAPHRRQREELLTLVERARPGVEATTALAALAAGRIWKAYRKVAAGITALDPEGPPSAVHDLRIGFKKLRYLLDACGRFTAPSDHLALTTELKELQGVLGSFNDAAVQFEALRSRAAMPGIPPEALLAIGALLAVLDQRRITLRQQLDPLLQRFAASPVRSQYRRLFRPEAA